MSLKGKRILVTGGAGFIGSHLVDALLSEDAVVSVIDDLSTGRRENLNKQAVFYEIDINSSQVSEVLNKEKPEIIYSLAFNTNVPKAVKDPLFDMRSLSGNLNVMVAAKDAGVRKIILASSGFVYGNTAVFPTPETEPVIPDNPYIITKFGSENYLYFFKKAHGLDFVVFRYATVYGPRQAMGAMADYIRSIAAGSQAVIYGHGTKTRDYVFVSDIIRANLMAAEFNCPPGISPIFNLGTSEETALNDLYSRLATLLDRPESKPFYQADRPGELMRFNLSYEKAKRCLGWEPTVDLDKGLQEIVKYFRLKTPT